MTEVTKPGASKNKNNPAFFFFFFYTRENMVLQLAARSCTANFRRVNVTLNKSFHVSAISRQQQEQQKKPLFGKFFFDS